VNPYPATALDVCLSRRRVTSLDFKMISIVKRNALKILSLQNINGLEKKRGLKPGASFTFDLLLAWLKAQVTTTLGLP